MPSVPHIELLDQFDSAAALFNPARLQILQQLAEPDSASGIARRLDLPRQQVNYHLRELEKAGLAEFIEERRKGNCIERVLRASARSYIISPEVLGELGRPPEQAADRFSMSYLVSLAARAIRDLARVRRRTIETGKTAATLGLEAELVFATPADRAAFADELAASVAQLAARYHAPKGRRFRLIAGCYPALEERTEHAPEV